MASEAQISTNVRVIQNNFVTNQCELHACLRLCLSLCRWAGMFPVEGLNKSTCTGLRFNIKSLYVIYHIATLVCQSMLAFITLYYFFINDLTLHNLTNILFYVTSWLSSMCLLKLASNWPKLIKRVGQIESCVVNVRSKKNIPKKTNMTVCFLMISALFEHILSLVFKVKLGLSKRDLEISKMNETDGFWDFVKIFVTKNAPYVFSYITYSDWIGVLYEFVNFQATFLWNFTDAMTMCISIYLTSYFRDLYEVIGRQKKQNTIKWEEIRVYYSYLVELVNEVNRNLCYMILLSLFTDLFFIVVQLFYLLQTQYSGPEYIIYYSYSFLLLFGRTMTTCLLAANVNTMARRPIIYLLNVSPSEYTIEVQRFIRQIRYTTTGLSGLYFYITRGMILTVIATVVKYELVLLQFRLRNFDSY